MTSVTAGLHVADACSCSLPALITLHRQALAMDPDSPRLPPELERLIFELAVQLHRPLAATLARVASRVKEWCACLPIQADIWC